jgi:rhodanese-related sulfurtransferase
MKMAPPTDAALKLEAEAMMCGYTTKFVGLPVMKSQRIYELLAQHDKAILLVDVREEKELKVSMLPTAITKAEFLSRKEGIPRTTCIVPYCTIGHRSGIFGKMLQEQGFENVHNGEGIVLWSHLENCKLVTGPEGSIATNRVHTYGSQWDKVPAHIKSVEFGYLAMGRAFFAYLTGW